MTSVQLCNKETLEEFYEVLPELVEEITSDPKFQDMPQTNQWLKYTLLENLQGGKKLRSSIAIETYKSLVPREKQNDDDMFRVYVLGWSIEFTQLSAIILDDIMDQSSTRRGKNCWYLKENGGQKIGLGAINDGVLVQQCANIVLEKYFRVDNMDIPFMRLTYDIIFRTSYGQSLDTQLGIQKSLEKFNMATYAAIVKNKTSYYSFYFPLIAGMLIAGLDDSKLHEEVEEVILRIGHLFQVQDDFLDCFGDIKKTMKIGTDIRDFKCSWLLVKALELADESQKRILQENVGSSDEEDIKRVEDLYRQLGIPEEFIEFEEREFENISEMIENLRPELPKDVLQAILNFIYRREA